MLVGFLVRLLNLSSIAQVAGIAEARYDVLVLVETLVYGSTPNGSVVGECLAYVLNAFGRCHYANHMHLLWGALGEQRLVAQLHRTASSEHRVDDEQSGVVEVGSGKILHMDANLGVSLVLILAECRNEGIAGVVEDVEEALVERQTGTEYGAEHQLVGRHIHLGNAKRSLYVALLLVERLAQLVSDKFAYTHDVVAEQQTVFLIVLVAHLRHILINNRVALAEIDNFHIVRLFLNSYKSTNKILYLRKYSLC